MENKGYCPQPADLTGVSLPEELELLAERLAKNVHEVWARRRVEQGWTFGKCRDDVAKTHPCLIPYEQLPEEEKDYDRSTSISTLQFILKSGFTIAQEKK
jgi:ryanodine receptor 2